MGGRLLGRAELPIHYFYIVESHVVEHMLNNAVEWRPKSEANGGVCLIYEVHKICLFV